MVADDILVVVVVVVVTLVELWVVVERGKTLVMMGTCLAMSG